MQIGQLVNLTVTLVVSAPLSVIIAQAVKRSSWRAGTKATVAAVVCMVVGVAQTYAAGSLLGLIGSWGTLTTAQVATWASAVWAAAHIEYNAYFKFTGWMGRLTSVLNRRYLPLS